MAERFLQQHEGADDIGLQKLAGTVDRAIDMAFGREMHDHVGLEPLEGILHGRGIGDIGADELVARIVLDRRERGEIAGIGQFVDHQHIVIGVGDQMAHDRRADKARAAGDQETFCHLSFHTRTD